MITTFLIVIINLAHAQSEPAEDVSALQASLVIKVQRRDDIADAMVSQARGVGGYFSSRTQDHIIFKIPTAASEDFLDFAAQQGIVVDRNFSSQALTEAIADVRAKLGAREDILDEYFEVLSDAGSESIVTVEREIVNLISQVEGLKGRLRYLQHQAAYADISISFQFKDRSAPSRDGSSSFAWLNTLNVADLVEDIRWGNDAQSPRRIREQSAPDGFAPYQLRDEFRAVSPDDVMYRIRTAKHEPRATLNFWEEAVRTRMSEAGYLEVSHERFMMDDNEGVLVELNSPYGSDDFTYLIGVVPMGRYIVIFEAAGEITRFTDRRDNIVSTIKSTSI